MQPPLQFYVDLLAIKRKGCGMVGGERLKIFDISTDCDGMSE